MALLLMLAKSATSRGLPKLRLYTNKRLRANIQLYEDVGFKAVGLTQVNGFDQVVMETLVTDLFVAGLPATPRG